MKTQLEQTASGIFYQPTKRDWVDDFPHENGNYDNECRMCGKIFRGYKERRICARCSKGDLVTMMRYRFRRARKLLKELSQP